MKASIRIGGLIALGVMAGFFFAQLNPADTVAAPWTSKSTYEFRHLRSNSGNQEVIRFNPKTGESWIIAGPSWEKLAESDKIPAGEYDILMVTGNEKVWWATRVEQVSGRAWNLGKEKWVEITEPK